MLANLGPDEGRLESAVALPPAMALVAGRGPGAVGAALPLATAVRQSRGKRAAGAAAAAGAVAGPRAAGPAAVELAAAAAVGLLPGGRRAPRRRGLVLTRLSLAGAARVHLAARRRTNAVAHPGVGLAAVLSSQLARGLPTAQNARAQPWPFWNTLRQKQRGPLEPKLNRKNNVKPHGKYARGRSCR